jgi:hypothetical protein
MYLHRISPEPFIDLNNCPPEPPSDHGPITVDLPFHEPQALTAKAAKESK